MSQGPAPLPHLGLLLGEVNSLAVTLGAMTCVSASGVAGIAAPVSLPHLSLVLYERPGAFLTKTLDTLTVSCAGTVVVAGNLRIPAGLGGSPFAPLTLVSSGTAVLNQGSIKAPAPLPHMSLLFEEIDGIVGNSIKTLEDLTCVSEGDAPGNEIWAYEDEDKPARPMTYWPHAYNIDWFQTDTVVREDFGGVFGVVGQDLLPLTVSSAVDVGGGLTLDQTLEDLTGTAEGTVEVAGTLSQTLGDMTCVSTASTLSDYVATLFTVFDALTVDSVVDGGIVGTVEPTLDDLTLSASTGNEVSGTLERTLQNINFNVDGSVLSDIVATFFQHLDPMTVVGIGETARPGTAGGVGTGIGKGRRKPKRFVVTIDDEDFIVESEEEAEALLAAAKELAEQKAKEEATAIVQRRLAIAKASDRALDVSAVNLERPTVKSDSEALQEELEKIIAKAYQRAEVDAEIAVRLAKQRLEDEEDSILLLLMNE